MSKKPEYVNLCYVDAGTFDCLIHILEVVHYEALNSNCVKIDYKCVI